jgi:hypothetical protein
MYKLCRVPGISAQTYIITYRIGRYVHGESESSGNVFIIDRNYNWQALLTLFEY